MTKSDTRWMVIYRYCLQHHNDATTQGKVSFELETSRDIMVSSSMTSKKGRRPGGAIGLQTTSILFVLNRFQPDKKEIFKAPHYRSSGFPQQRASNADNVFMSSCTILYEWSANRVRSSDFRHTHGSYYICFTACQIGFISHKEMIGQPEVLVWLPTQWAPQLLCWSAEKELNSVLYDCMSFI